MNFVCQLQKCIIVYNIYQYNVEHYINFEIMADTKISALSALGVTSVAGEDVLPIVNGNETKKIKVSVF